MTPANSDVSGCNTPMMTPTVRPMTSCCSNTPSSMGRTAPTVIKFRRTHMRKVLVVAALLTAGAANPAWANLNVFACEPEWGALSTELGGDKVSVYNATTGLQDPHQIQARPSLIAKARSADIAVCDGAELEI